MTTYKFQCPKCYIISGHMSQDPRDAPKCCNGEPMVAIEVTPESASRLKEQCEAAGAECAKAKADWKAMASRGEPVTDEEIDAWMTACERIYANRQHAVKVCKASWAIDLAVITGGGR